MAGHCRRSSALLPPTIISAAAAACYHVVVMRVMLYVYLLQLCSAVDYGYKWLDAT